MDIELEKVIPEKDPRDTIVTVAMSGGIDSSTVAAFLHKSGYRVIGITLELYGKKEKANSGRTCCAGQDIEDAKKVAQIMGFSHYTLNYEKEFKESVIDNFTDSYMKGETPIPCVRCNQTVKFHDLLRISKEIGADALATGHYVRRIIKDGKVQMHTAIDQSKDQSYFLFATTKEQLQYLRFPLGNLYKNQTRELAKSLGLPIFDKPESQDICFVNSASYREFISKMKPDAIQEGEIVDIDGQVIKKHSGIMNYTVGQRHGLGIAHSEPLYVVQINAQTRQVVVGPKNTLLKKKFTIKELNFISDQEFLSTEMQAQIKLRSLQSKVSATIYPKEDDRTDIELDVPQHAIAPGQACVIYDGTQVLGGGWIN